MIQSMEILQLPIMALNERIEEELSENVVLEQATADSDVSETEAQVELERARDEASPPELDQKTPYAIRRSR